MFWEIAQTVILAITAGAVVLYAWETKKLRSAVVTQTKQTAEQNARHALTTLANEHNWRLFDRRRELPPALPAWSELTDSGWAWRVLHFNHLNELKQAYEDHRSGSLSDYEMTAWTLMARNWFGHIQPGSQSEQIREGCEILKQVLRREEGFQDDFRRWLVSSDIISMNLIADLEMT